MKQDIRYMMFFLLNGLSGFKWRYIQLLPVLRTYALSSLPLAFSLWPLATLSSRFEVEFSVFRSQRPYALANFEHR